MRPHNPFETRNVKFMVDRQVDFTTIQITATGLKKSILDATAPVREYLRSNGIHDYDQQPQGQENKRLVTTYILTDVSKYQTRTSFYRPFTKKGDPRLWVNKIAGVEYLHADDIFAIIAYNDILFVVNLSTINIETVCKSMIDTPLKDLINNISRNKSSVSDELLTLIKDKMADWIPAEIMADTGIGRTVESVLGIPMNSSKNPDYKGIELKSHREAAKVRNALFTQVPDWTISRFKNSRQIVDRYGYYPDGTNQKTLQVTLTANRPNSQNLGLKMETRKGLLEADEFCLNPDNDGEYTKLMDVAAWKLVKLHERLLSKHRETFWIDVETRLDKGQEYFRCSEILHTKNPIPSQFDILLDQGHIQVDFLLCRPSGNGDTYSFKIKRNARELLFPNPGIYRLI